MEDKTVTGIIAVLTAVIGVSILATLVSKQSNTSAVLTAGGNAFSSILKVALSPVGGSSLSGGLSLPSLPTF